jgi:acyl-CoA synthetase (AMP-forming)/AMP-acid ligase II/aryl carrier-like protein
MDHPLSPYQLLFFNRELNFGSPKSNILKGNVRISGADYSKLKNAIIDVLKDAEWAYLSINVANKSWDKLETWNGSFQEKIVEPEISLEGQLWSVQLIQESENNILLRLCLHHCLGDAHSFNLFWNSVYTRYKSGDLVKLDSLRDTAPEISIFPTQEETKELPVDLGIGTIKRLSYHFNSRVLKHLNKLATEKSGSIMAFVLEQIESELSVSEKHLEIPLKIGIALRNRKNKFQKNSFPTCVNFLPLIKEENSAMRQRILNVFRYQDYPLLDFLVNKNQRVAFNVLFSYQKESYEFADNLDLNFNFEPSSADDNILGIHLLEYGDDLMTVHVDYRTDIASEYYWKTFIRSIVLKIAALSQSKSDEKQIYRDSILIPNTIENIEFWHWFDQADDSKIALVCNDIQVNFGELKRKIEEIKFDENQELVKLKPERTLNNIVHLLAAWRNGLAVSYHEVNENCLDDSTGIAYVAKTSGTSGTSKTILISFDSLKTLIPDWKKIYQTEQSVHLSLADQRFDVFFGDLLRSVLSGETLVLATDEERLDAEKISSLIQQFNVTHLESTPSFLGYLLPNLNKTDSLKTIICGSEPILDSFYRITQKTEFNQIQFFNSYGLTECSIDSTVSELKRTNEGKFPSGFVVGDQTITIQDNSGAVKPMGIWGEVQIEGECVGINVESNNHNKKYATGDLGMITLNDGLIVGGRINNDFIKVNGRRVPAGMIESLVSQIDKVQACLCLEVRNSAVLFVNGDSNEDEIKHLLSNTLSKYQLPDTYFFSETWPINQNGKADREQLIEWYQNSFESGPTWQPNGDSKQEILYDCLIKRNKPFGSQNESFISFGWNSIELLSLANELNLKGLFVPLTSFIQNPTINFILESIEGEINNSTTENPEADDFDIDDILSVLND